MIVTYRGNFSQYHVCKLKLMMVKLSRREMHYFNPNLSSVYRLIFCLYMYYIYAYIYKLIYIYILDGINFLLDL